MPFRRLFLLFFAFVFMVASTGHAQFSKGHQILIDRGLQLQALAQDDCYFHLNTLSNANYTSAGWIESVNPTNSSQTVHSSRPDLIGDAPGFAWGRWADNETQMPPHITPYGGDETPYMPQLVTLCLADEWFLNDDAVRTRLVNWFVSVRTNYPNTILFHNNWGTEVGDSQLDDFCNRAKPDMLSFDTYPWQSVYDTNQVNNTGPAIPGPPTGWYQDLRRYREHAKGAGIPFGIYRQTFHSVESGRVYRDPSKSELRLNTFGALAFNAKMFTDFVYNTGANSLFTNTLDGVNYLGYAGDSNPSTNGLYIEMTDVNKRARNFGKALVRLTPISAEGYAGYTTSMMIIEGKNSSGVLNPIPIGFLSDRDTPSAVYTDWVYQRNDPYLTNNWVITNSGTKNNGQPGDVIVSWFKPLDESFDGPNYTNEIYMMVVNGLSDPTGTAADCAQQINLNFHSSLGAVEMLNPLTCLAELQQLPLTNGSRQLVLNLNGGDAAFFKFADGAPFVGVQKVAVTGAPIITIHPVSRENLLGTSATFNAQAYGSALLSFQWQFNGTNIAGATSLTYTRSNVQFADGGSYTFIASNTSGSVTSTPAMLTLVSAQPFFYEPFNYPNIGSPVSSNNPANWTFNPSTATNDVMVSAGSLSYPGLVTSVGNSITNGGIGLGARRLLGTNLSSGTIYFSVLFKMIDPGYGTWKTMPSQIASLMSTNNSNVRIGILVTSNTPSTYRIGLQKGGTAGPIDTTPRNFGDTVFIVGKYDFTTTPNPVTMWINPSTTTFGASSEPVGGIVLTTTTGLDFNSTNTIDRFNFRQNTFTDIPAAMQWDELRIGTSWRDATPIAPPPAPSTLTNVMRLANGSFQFSYSSSNAQTSSVYASTNLLNWTFVGTPSQISPGLYQFTDAAATNFVNRFYQLRFP